MSKFKAGDLVRVTGSVCERSDANSDSNREGLVDRVVDIIAGLNGDEYRVGAALSADTGWYTREKYLVAVEDEQADEDALFAPDLTTFEYFGNVAMHGAYGLAEETDDGWDLSHVDTSYAGHRTDDAAAVLFCATGYLGGK